MHKAANQSDQTVIGEINSKGQGLTVTTGVNPSNRATSLNLDASPVTMMKNVVDEDNIPKTAMQKQLWKEILQTRELINDQMDGLDENLNKVLKKHEYEYMQAYNIQVKKKEQELLKAMEDLASEQNAELKDIKIQKLEASVSKLRRENTETEKAKEKLREEVRSMKKKYEYEKSEHEFYQKNAMENKRKNKLLKVAVGRLQSEYDKLLDKYKVTDDELKFVKQLHSQIERV